jgi:hypothetical protein
MKIRILAAALLAAPVLAQAQALPSKEPAKKEAAPKKDAAKGAPPRTTTRYAPRSARSWSTAKC